MLHAHITSILVTYCYLQKLQLQLKGTAEYAYSLMPQNHHFCLSIFKAVRAIKAHQKQEQYLHSQSLKTDFFLLYNAQGKSESHRQS